jgi:hypothetical protein
VQEGLCIGSAKMQQGVLGQGCGSHGSVIDLQFMKRQA